MLALRFYLWFYLGILAKPIFLCKIHGPCFLAITRHKWKLHVVLDVENLESQHNVEAEDAAPGDLQNLPWHWRQQCP